MAQPATGNPAGRPAPARPAVTPALGESDRGFLLEAARGALVEVELSKLAEQRTQNPLIKAYAAMLVRDHSEANDELRQLALARGLTLPDAASPEQRSMIDAMKALPAEEFDRRFVQQIGIAGHQADIRRYEAMAGKAADPELKGWATRMLALLREHLAAAQRLPSTTQARASWRLVT